MIIFLYNNRILQNHVTIHDLFHYLKRPKLFQAKTLFQIFLPKTTLFLKSAPPCNAKTHPAHIGSPGYMGAKKVKHARYAPGPVKRRPLKPGRQGVKAAAYP